MVNCNKCGQSIHFDDEVLSATGKKIPLQGATGFDKHDCPNNPYKGGKLGGQTQEQVVKQVPSTGNLEVLAFKSVVDGLSERVGRLEQAVEQFGEVLAKQSFQKGSGEAV